MKLHHIYHGLLFMAGHRAVAAPPAPPAPAPDPAATDPVAADSAARAEVSYATWSRHGSAPAQPAECTA